MATYLVLSAVRANAQTTCPLPHTAFSFSYPAPPRPDPAEMGDGFFMATTPAGKTSSPRTVQENTIHIDVTRYIPGVNSEGFLDTNLVPTLVSDGLVSTTVRLSVGVSSVGNLAHVSPEGIRE
jgi:hypothetical protein